MKILRYMLLFLAAITVFVAGFMAGNDRRPTDVISTEEKVTVYDTIQCFAPVAKSELSVGTRVYTLPSFNFQGAGAGGKPRQRPNAEAKIVSPDSAIGRTYGTGAGGEPRCSPDSAIVELPIIQRHYADSAYEAWVSGPVDPRLDSINVFVPTTTITKREWRPPKRWHIGPTIGFGITPHGFQPYIGCSITYSIISF